MGGVTFFRMTILRFKTWGTFLMVLLPLLGISKENLRLNEVQFVGSHNSYKQKMPFYYFWTLRLLDSDAAKALEYWHPPLSKQLELGLRKLELDLFYDSSSGEFPVGHIQVIDM